jgi:hypothetical protein
MAHIIKWKTEPEKRHRSWSATIENTRIEIEELIEFEPTLKPSLRVLLKELFKKAKRLAEKEMGKTTTLTELSWQEVLNNEYNI